MNEIDEIATKTEMDTTGETSVKIMAKEKLAIMASSLAALLGYTYSDLKYSKDNECLQIASAIEVELLENQALVADYMISEENLAELHSLMVEFEASIEERGGVKSGSVAETRRLAILFRVSDDLLNKKLDRFITRLKTDYPTFYDAYQNARMIVDL